MIIFAALIGLLESVLYYAILFLIGKMLTHSQQLRSFLSLKSKDEGSYSFFIVSESVEKVGNILMILAGIGVLYSVVTTFIIITS